MRPPCVLYFFISIGWWAGSSDYAEAVLNSPRFDCLFFTRACFFALQQVAPKHHLPIKKKNLFKTSSTKWHQTGAAVFCLSTDEQVGVWVNHVLGWSVTCRAETQWNGLNVSMNGWFIVNSYHCGTVGLHCGQKVIRSGNTAAVISWLCVSKHFLPRFFPAGSVSVSVMSCWVLKQLCLGLCV